MIAKEGRVGRVFVVTLEAEDKLPETLEAFAAERGIGVAQVFMTSDKMHSGILAPDMEGRPVLRLTGEAPTEGFVGEAVVHELLGLRFQRNAGDGANAPSLTPVASSVTRVMEEAAPSPREAGPASIPVYLFNAEFN